MGNNTINRIYLGQQEAWILYSPEGIPAKSKLPMECPALPNKYNFTNQSMSLLTGEICPTCSLSTQCKLIKALGIQISTGTL